MYIYIYIYIYILYIYICVCVCVCVCVFSSFAYSLSLVNIYGNKGAVSVFNQLLLYYLSHFVFNSFLSFGLKKEADYRFQPALVVVGVHLIHLHSVGKE